MWLEWTTINNFPHSEADLFSGSYCVSYTPGPLLCNRQTIHKTFICKLFLFFILKLVITLHRSWSGSWEGNAVWMVSALSYHETLTVKAGQTRSEGTREPFRHSPVSLSWPKGTNNPSVPTRVIMHPVSLGSKQLILWPLFFVKSHLFIYFYYAFAN